MARSAKLKFPNKWPAFLIGLIKIRTVYWTKMRLVAWVVLVAKGGHKGADNRAASAGKDVRKVADSRAASAEKDGHREVLTQLPASRLVVEALVGKVADQKEEALVVKAAGRRVAKAARKAVAVRVVLLPLAFQVKASHNPDKDSTW